ncbi:glutamate--tRNA ligase [uncultured Tyzzerella sp.]|uniref:glutamate--tRNA ligase n=1 Tax=uncultured Tyzzerella sp. TaxID=2321398 RepID=UPI002F40A972
MVRTRFAPSPTGYMHIGNLRTALYEYLIAKVNNGKFILRIEDTDQGRLVEGATDIIYKTLKMAGINHDEGPDIGGEYGPYIQSERKNNYLEYAKQLVAKGEAYYCFCDKERLDTLKGNDGIAKYDRHCLSLSKEEIEEKLKQNLPFVIRQKIKEGKTTFVDEVYGEITVENDEMEDQILIKSDGLPTYNFANVIDDHLMNITHVVRGSEYLSSTPKYNLLYDAFGWDIPTYIHLPPVMKNQTEKLSKRNGDASFQDLIEKGYLPEAIVNYIALLGWSPSNNQEIFTLDELIQNFDIKGLSKSPAIFDIVKLTWLNGEYIKKMDFDRFFEMSEPVLKNIITKPYNLKKIAEHIKTRIGTINEITDLVDFIEELPDYNTELYIHKKMKTDEAISLQVLKNILPIFESLENWDNDSIYSAMMDLVSKMEVKNGIVLWPIRTALSGKASSPCGASEMAEIFGKEETLERIKKGIEKLS